MQRFLALGTLVTLAGVTEGGRLASAVNRLRRWHFFLASSTLPPHVLLFTQNDPQLKIAIYLFRQRSIALGVFWKTVSRCSLSYSRLFSCPPPSARAF